MAGATVLHGTMSFGAHSRMHTQKILRLLEDLPIVIEIVDRPELDEMIAGGPVTLENVKVIAYRHDGTASHGLTT